MAACGKSLKRANLIRPNVIPIGTSPTPLFPGEVEVNAFWILVQVRTMGTDTYIRVGDSINQVNSFAGIGDFQLFDVPEGYDFNAAELYAISDAGTGYLEISGMGPSGKLTGMEVF
jgi:hypothetical protein